jgi:hypothetical protein
MQRAVFCVFSSPSPSWRFLRLPRYPRIECCLGWWPQEPLKANLTWFLILATCDMHAKNVMRGAVISYPK